MNYEVTPEARQKLRIAVAQAFANIMAERHPGYTWEWRDKETGEVLASSTRSKPLVVETSEYSSPKTALNTGRYDTP